MTSIFDAVNGKTCRKDVHKEILNRLLYPLIKIFTNMIRIFLRARIIFVFCDKYRIFVLCNLYVNQIIYFTKAFQFFNNKIL